MGVEALSRRALLGSATAIAVVGVPNFAASAEPAGTSSALHALIAAALEAQRNSDAYHRNAYVPADARRAEAVAAAKAGLPHVTINAGSNMEGHLITWSTSSAGHVAAARTAVQMARDGYVFAPEYIGAARKLLAAHIRRERAIDRARRSEGLGAIIDHCNALSDANADAGDAVARYAVETPADLALKLAFMVERAMGDGVDWLPELLADARRLAKMEG